MIKILKQKYVCNGKSFSNKEMASSKKEAEMEAAKKALENL